MYEFDIPADADPARVYGTPEFERKRFSHVAVPVRRAVEPVEKLTAEEALQRFRAVQARMYPTTRNLVYRATQVAPEAKAEPAPAKAPEPYVIRFIPLPDEVDRVACGTSALVTIADIVSVCAHYYGISRLDLISHRRTANLMKPRQIAMYLAKMLTPHGLPMIAKHVGGRDHTTAIHAIRKYTSLVETDETIAKEVSDIRMRLTGEPA